MGQFNFFLLGFFYYFRRIVNSYVNYCLYNLLLNHLTLGFSVFPVCLKYLELNATSKTFSSSGLLKSDTYCMYDLLMERVKTSLHKKMKFSIKEFFSKCDQIRRKLRIWSHLLKKSLMENFFGGQCFLSNP